MDLQGKKLMNVAETVRNMYNPKPIQPVEEASMMKDDGKVVHNCAKHVEHTTWGKGTTMAEQHDAPDDAGNIGWYDVLFDHGLERAVPTVNLNILVSENHGHPVKKKKMTEGKVYGHEVDVKKYDSHLHGREGEYYDGLSDHEQDKEHLHHLMKKHGYKEDEHYTTNDNGMHDDMLHDVNLKAPHHKEILKHPEIKHFLHHLEHGNADKPWDYKKGKEEVNEALHPNQQKLDVHEPEKDELTADDFKKLRAGKKAKVKEDTEVKEALSGDNSRNTENDRTKETALQAAKAAAVKTTGTAAVPGQVHGAKVGGERDIIKQGVTTEDVDQTIIYHTADLYLEALMSKELQDRMKSHEKAGHKVSDQASRMKSGEMEYSFVVTQPSGKRSRHIYHGNKTKHETMAPAPKSPEAKEVGDDEDDK